MTKWTLFVLFILGFCALCQKADAQITLGKPVVRVPLFSHVKEIEEFSCKLDNITTNETILYELFKEGRSKRMWDYSAHNKEEAKFQIVTKLNYDGRYRCKASVQNNSLNIIPTFSNWTDFHVLVPIKGVIPNTWSKDLWERDSLTLQCNVTEGTYVLYDWLLNDVPLRSNVAENHLTIASLSSKDSGKYLCITKNYYNETELYSNMTVEMNILVKEYLSQPTISFEVVKDKEGNFTSNVKCEVTRGSLPIIFTFFMSSPNWSKNLKRNDSRNASISLPIKLDMDMGDVYCKVSNGKTPMRSRHQNLTVVSVGGDVTMSMKKAVGQDFEVYGVWLHCHVERGTFPQYYWFLNDTKLEKNGRFYHTFDPNDSGLMVSLDPNSGSAGVYHCEVVNAFDKSTRVSSQKTLISHEVFNKIPTEVVAIVFTFFALLICAVLACCIYGVVSRNRQSRKYMFRLKDFTGKNNKMYSDDKIEEIEEDKYEEVVNNDLDTEAYIEDMDVVQASMMKDSDESEEDDETNLDNYIA